MKTIIIHHVQGFWSQGYENAGTSFAEMIHYVEKHLSENHYDKVIVTNFEGGNEIEFEQELIRSYVHEVYSYNYGWSFCSIEMKNKEVRKIENGEIGTCRYGNKYTQGGMHSQIVAVDEWMFDLEGEIHICGAFDGECIEDLEIALKGAGKEFNRINHLII